MMLSQQSEALHDCSPLSSFSQPHHIPIAIMQSKKSPTIIGTLTELNGEGEELGKSLCGFLAYPALLNTIRWRLGNS